MYLYIELHDGVDMCLLCVQENRERLTPLELVRNFVEIIGDDDDEHAMRVSEIISEHLTRFDDDELVEITPGSIRLRKKLLTEGERRRDARLRKKASA